MDQSGPNIAEGGEELGEGVLGGFDGVGEGEGEGEGEGTGEAAQLWS
jgi:hypothetical protein